MYHEKFGQLVTSLQNLRARVPSVQIEQLMRLSKAIEAHGRDVRPTYRKYFNMASNLLKSLSEGLASGDATEKDYVKAIDELDTYANAVEALENELSDGSKTRIQDDFLAMMGLETKRAMDKYAPFKQMVPETSKSRILVKRLPIVVITDPFLVPEKVKAMKLGTDFIFGYPVLEQQVVAGLKVDFVSEAYRNNYQAALQEVLDGVRERTGKEFVQIGEGMRRGNVTWFWLINQVTLAKLNKAAAGSHFKLKDWAFPFEPKAFEPHDQRIREKLKPLWEHDKNKFPERVGRTPRPERM